MQNAKASHIFSIWVILDCNKTLTNQVISFEQPDPDVYAMTQVSYIIIMKSLNKHQL